MRLRRIIWTAAKWGLTAVAAVLLVLGPLSWRYHSACWLGPRSVSVLMGVESGSAYVMLAQGVIGQGTSPVGGNIMRARMDGLKWWEWWWDWQPKRIGGGNL